MDKALKMGKDSATGSFQLFISTVASTVILAVSAIFVGMFIEDVEYGLYVVALIPMTTFLLFQDWGVGAALTKYCARYRTDGKEKNLSKIIVAGLTFEVVTGLILTIFSFLVAGFVASVVSDRPEATLLIIISSIGIFFASIYRACNAIFVGFERMDLMGVSLICQAIVVCALSPLLVYSGYGGLGAMLGYTFSQVISGIVSAILLYLFVFRKLKYYRLTRFELSETIKVLLRYGIPLAIAVLLTGALIQFYSFMMANYCDLAIVGHYKITTNFAVLITFFTIPISTVLFPIFSKLDPRKDENLLKSIYSSAIKYSTFFSLPATIALMILANPLISTIYGDKWFHSPFFLSLYLIQYLFVLFGGIGSSILLQGLGETKLLLKLHVLTLSIGIPLAFLLIPPFEIVGLILTGLFSPLPSMFIGLYLIWKRFGAKPDFSSSAKILLASAISGSITYIFLNFFVAAPWIMFTTGTLLFLFVYLVSSPLIGAISQIDVNNLRVMFSGLGLISKVLEILIKLIEKQLEFKSKFLSSKKQN